MDNYCEYIHADCEYLVICKKHTESICLRMLFGEEILLKPEYSPQAILKRLMFFRQTL